MGMTFEEFHAQLAEREKYGAEQPVNIFYLDHDPELVAQAHCDRHVVKMVLETAQLLSTAWHVLRPAKVQTEWAPCAPDVLAQVAWRSDPLISLLGGCRIYRKTHAAHPSAEWVRESAGNYDWAWRLGMALLEEYTFRYGRRHATEPVLWALEANPAPAGSQTEPPCAMPEDCVVVNPEEGMIDAVASYRNYYRVVKAPLLKYTKRGEPAWIRG